MIRRTTLVSAAAAALVLVPTAALAYDAPGYSSTVSDASPTAGAPFRFAVDGASDIAGKAVLLTVTSNPASLPNSAIQIAGTQSVEKVANASGDVAFTVTLKQAGSYSVQATVDGAAVSQLDLAVAGAKGSTAAAAHDGALAATGFDGAGLATGAGALVVAGAAAVMIAKRRQSAQLGA